MNGSTHSSVCLALFHLRVRKTMRNQVREQTGPCTCVVMQGDVVNGRVGRVLAALDTSFTTLICTCGTSLAK